ncbi:ampG domain protein [Rickettsia amblyommatis str. Darkwater]|nr:ampG domain protein [Rickettsia amblyommatis str. Darkwater]
MGRYNPLRVTPWLDHGVQKTIKNTNNFSIFNWIPRSGRRMTGVKLIHATKLSRVGGNDIE